MINDITLRISPEISATPDKLLAAISRHMGFKISDINDFKILRKSIDARQKKVMVNLTVRVASKEDLRIENLFKPKHFVKLPSDAEDIIIVGAGPAGLFAALKAIELGLRPIVLERGHDVDTRRVELAALSREKR